MFCSMVSRIFLIENVRNKVFSLLNIDYFDFLKRDRKVKFLPFSWKQNSIKAWNPLVVHGP